MAGRDDFLPVTGIITFPSIGEVTKVIRGCLVGSRDGEWFLNGRLIGKIFGVRGPSKTVVTGRLRGELWSGGLGIMLGGNP